MALVEDTKKNWGYSSYRDSLTTVDRSGIRIWLFPKKPFGKWLRRREILGYILFIFFISAPFVHIGGHPILMFNIIDRKFIIFGGVFWPSDFFIFLLALLTIIVFIFLFTAIFGRLWCGWACPQTIFMELIFRKIEYWIEGSAAKQKELSKIGWTSEKILKRSLKYFIFFVVSFGIANVFLAYLIGSLRWSQIVNDNPLRHLPGFLSLLGFTGVFLFVYAYLREQVCTIICPYGRLQSVLIDSHTLVVAYNNKVGEPRAKWGKNRPADSGACIGCRQCVDVCPTGIDIRNGIQMECINCTVCIDVCDHVMEITGQPKGLISYASLDGIEKGEKFGMNSRRIFYSVILFLLAGILVLILSYRSSFSATILRVRGMEFTELPNGMIRNIYTVSATNKTFKAIPLKFKFEKYLGDASIKLVGNEITIPAEGMSMGLICVDISKRNLKGENTPVTIGIYSGEKRFQSIETNFMGPIK